jgi:hypothetical protein
MLFISQKKMEKLLTVENAFRNFTAAVKVAGKAKAHGSLGPTRSFSVFFQTTHKLHVVAPYHSHLRQVV